MICITVNTSDDADEKPAPQSKLASRQQMFLCVSIVVSHVPFSF